MGRIFVGTSGWNYNHWKKVFYPERMPSSEWLSHYVKFFNSIELNVTFYRLVKKDTFEHWRQKTPAGFYFVAKGSRFITHTKKIKSVAGPLDVFLRQVAGLKEKLLAILWQFPPNFQKDAQRLAVFLKLLARKTKTSQVFEFRHKTWFDEEVYGILRQHNACLCIAHSQRRPSVKKVTADFIYLRFHGGGPGRSNYTTGQLQDWGSFARKFKRGDILAFFNNDAEGFAVKNAMDFEKILTTEKERV